jgi:antitoxin component of RelBE/YafQ-DinJ toxin-antitoxin module
MNINQINRLFTFGKIWGEIKYFNPYIHLNEIDWNNVFCEAYFVIKNCKDDQFSEIINKQVLTKLGDPFGGILANEELSDKKINEYKLLKKNIAFLTINDCNTERINEVMEEAINDVGKLNGLIIDIQTKIDYVNHYFKMKNFFSYFVKGNLTGCSDLTLEYCGFPDESKPSRYSPYSASYKIYSNHHFINGLSKKQIPIVFIVHSKISLPSEILTLRKHHKCLIINTNPNRMYKSHFYNYIKTKYGDFNYSPEIPLFSGATLPVLYDYEVKESESLDFATELINNYPSKTIINDTIDISKQILSDSFDKSFELPNESARVMSIIKIYTVIKYFYPHETKKSKTWDDVARKFISDAINVQSRKEFMRVLEEMGTYIDDAHVYLFYHKKNSWGKIPIKVDYIEDNFIVTKILNRKYQDKFDISCGDIIKKFNGIDIEEDFQNKKKYICGSREIIQRRNYCSLHLVLGDLNKKYTLEVQTINHKTLLIEETYNRDLNSDNNFHPFRIYNNNVLYIDSNELRDVHEEKLYRNIEEFQKIVIDMRAYPSFTNMLDFLKSLSITDNFYWGRHKVPIINFFNSISMPNFQRFQNDYTAITVEPKHKRDLVILVDHNTQSYAEAICDSLRASSNAILVGSNTAGANGNVSRIKLPSDITMSFTGMIHLQHNGESEQKVGLTPDYFVEQTLEAAQSERDTVIEKAVNILSSYC